MSLFIEGMDMPTYKGEHKDFDRYGCFLTVYKDGKVELHICNTDYTVKEVQSPHGDLIDYDDIVELASQKRNRIVRQFDCIDVFDVIDDVPVIVKAEVSEQ